MEQKRHLIRDIYDSFFNNNKGGSARKFAAATSVWFSIYLAIKHTTSDNVVMVCVIFLTFSALCLGLVTAEQIINKLNGTTVIQQTATISQDQSIIDTRTTTSPSNNTMVEGAENQQPIERAG